MRNQILSAAVARIERCNRPERNLKSVTLNPKSAEQCAWFLMRRVPTALHWPVFDKTYCLAALIVDTDVVNERCRQAVICCSQVTSHPARVCLDRPTLSVSQPQRRVLLLLLLAFGSVVGSHHKIDRN